MNSTITRLKTLRAATATATAATSRPSGETRLAALDDFGSNPGALDAFAFVPTDLPPRAPLVVVLHGCTQSAAGYDQAAGWTSAADRFGFAVLFPEQRRMNNPNLCFTWFSAADTARGAGEAHSIRQMVAAMQARHDLDPQRIFVTGLSAGGAMTAAMLASYPEVFAGGAVIAGLPYGVATSVPEAFDRMRGHELPAAHDLTTRVKDASRYAGPWPTLSVWHGSADATVDPANGRALVDQWRGLHDLPEIPSCTDLVDGAVRRTWNGPEGTPFIEHIAIAGMGHGTPVGVRASEGDEQPAPFMLEVGISSTRRILESWGLAPAVQHKRTASKPAAKSSPAPASAVALPKAMLPSSPASRRAAAFPPSADPITRTIESALRKAGLMR